MKIIATKITIHSDSSESVIYELDYTRIRNFIFFEEKLKKSVDVIIKKHIYSDKSIRFDCTAYEASTGGYIENNVSFSFSVADLIKHHYEKYQKDNKNQMMIITNHTYF